MQCSLQVHTVEPVLGLIYTERQRQRCDNAAMMLVILIWLKTMQSLRNGLQPHSEATPLFSTRTGMPASSQSCCSIHADAWWKRALTEPLYCKATGLLHTYFLKIVLAFYSCIYRLDCKTTCLIYDLFLSCNLKRLQFLFAFGVTRPTCPKLAFSRRFPASRQVGRDLALRPRLVSCLCLLKMIPTKQHNYP